jgi:glycosyltransferase involved in cell wall biosynthesis
MLRHINELGGTPEYTRRLVSTLLSLDHDNDYLLLFGSETAYTRYRFPNAKSILLRAPSKLLWDQVMVPKVLKRERVDVVFNLKHSIPLFGPSKKVFIVHGADWIAYPKGFYLADQLYHKIFLPRYLHVADRVITISQASARKLTEYMPSIKNKLSVVYHGLPPGFCRVEDTTRLEAFRTRLGLPERFVSYVGQIYPPKNVGGILRAMAQLKGHIPHKLVIAGKPGIKAEQDLALIEQLGLEKDVVQIGWIPHEELPLLYSLTDALVFPSLFDGFGIPLIEAMACGCPIVTSTTGACPEVVGDAGLCVDPTDIVAIAEGIRAVVGDRDLASKLACHGLERAKLFSWERTARETLAVLTAARDARANDDMGALIACAGEEGEGQASSRQSASKHRMRG